MSGKCVIKLYNRDNKQNFYKFVVLTELNKNM